MYNTLCNLSDTSYDIRLLNLLFTLIWSYSSAKRYHIWYTHLLPQMYGTIYSFSQTWMIHSDTISIVSVIKYITSTIANLWYIYLSQYWYKSAYRMQSDLFILTAFLGPLTQVELESGHLLWTSQFQFPLESMDLKNAVTSTRSYLLIPDQYLFITD